MKYLTKRKAGKVGVGLGSGVGLKQKLGFSLISGVFEGGGVMDVSWRKN